jgi:hypothetical protein
MIADSVPLDKYPRNEEYPPWQSPPISRPLPRPPSSLMPRVYERDLLSVTGRVLSLVYHNHCLFQHAAQSGVFDDRWYWNTTTYGWTEYRITGGRL